MSGLPDHEDIQKDAKERLTGNLLTNFVCMTRAILACIAALALVASSASLPGQSYSAFSLGGGTPVAINNAGQIVGYEFLPDYVGTRAVLFSGGGGDNIDLGTLGGPYSTARDINDFGQIVGNSSLLNRFGVSETVAFISSGGVMTDLGALTIGVDFLLSPADINDWGQILAGSLLVNPINPLTTASGIKFFGGMGYERFEGLSETGGLATTVNFLGGTAGIGGAYLANRDVNVSFIDRGSNPLASDIVSLSGTSGACFTDTIVLQLTYDEATAIALFGSESVVRWFDSLTNQWTLAVAGNTGGSPFFAGDRPYDPATDFVLGYYGVDTESNTVWAVHSSEFAVVPEPATYILLAIGMFFLLCKSRRARLTYT